MVQSYSAAGANVPSHEGTLAPPERIRLNLCFLRPTWIHNLNGKSIGSVFLYSSRQKVHVLYNGQHFPKNCPFPWISGPIKHNSLGPSEPITQMASRSVHQFLHRWPQSTLSFTMTPLSPSKLPLPMWGSGPPHVTCGMWPPESSTQTASGSVQPFLQGSPVSQTNRQTDRPRYSSITIGRIYVRSTAMRPNNYETVKFTQGNFDKANINDDIVHDV